MCHALGSPGHAGAVGEQYRFIPNRAVTLIPRKTSCTDNAIRIWLTVIRAAAAQVNLDVK